MTRGKTHVTALGLDYGVELEEGPRLWTAGGRFESHHSTPGRFDQGGLEAAL